MNEKPTQQQQPAANPAAIQKREVAAFLSSEAVRNQVAKVLPKHVTPERMVRIAVTAVMRKPELQQACDHPVGRASLLNALMICSQAGLEPDGRLAHLIPFYSSKNRCFEVQVIFDWKGLVTLGLRNGFESIYADVVCDNDEFDAYVENGVKKLLHRVNWKVGRGNPYLVYCVTMRSGVLDYEIMTIEETEEVRSRSRAKDGGPWVTDTLEMRKKSPIRRMSKRWDLLPELRDVINADDDTPPPLDAPKAMSTPLFGTKQPEQLENGTKPEPEPEKQAEVAGPSPLETMRGLLVKAKLTEANLLDYLASTGSTDGSVGSLDELVMTAPEVVNGVIDQWAEISGRMVAALKKGGAK